MKISAIKKNGSQHKAVRPKTAGSCCQDTENAKDANGDGSCSHSTNKQETAPCCGPAAVITGGEISERVQGFIKWLETPAGRTPQISTSLSLSDHLGACKARWGIGRMNYIVPPGLYAIGCPGPESPVLVTANYKMSYDILRHTLSNRDLWLLVLETFGVNVWCAAGKGTFGTDELVRRINRSDLHSVVQHRELILPILGAPGIAAHQVRKRTGFNIRYATIRARDLPEYLDNGRITTPPMREMSFSAYERLVLVPVEIILTMKSMALFGGPLFLAGWLAKGHHAAATLFWAYLGAVLTGLVAAPLLLPWVPGRSFALKGALLGLAWCALFFMLCGGEDWRITTTIAAFLGLPSISAYYALNFTGCTTYTSRSGVKKEMRLGLPLMGFAIAAGIVLLLLSTMSR